jgi:hypothetical protein
MPVTAGAWEEGSEYDLHVLRGTRSRHLIDDLFLNDSGTWKPANAAPLPADVRGIRFDVGFDGGLVGNLWTGQQVEVDIKSGEVHPLAVSPAVALRSFRIDAIITVDDPANPGTTKNLDPIALRVQIHESITRAWLTPSRLRINQGANGQRFTLLAEFDDRTVGDITTIGDVDGADGVTWSSNVANVTVEPVLGELTVTGPGTATITATLSASLGGSAPVGHVDVVAAWNAQPAATRAARLLNGPGAARLDDVPNVLFVPEGFTAAERADFDALVSQLERQLRRSRLSAPYNLLANSINYWAVFIDSAERGVSVSNGVRPIAGPAGSTLGRELPFPRAPQPGAASFTLEELVFVVGLPVPDDVELDLDLAAKLAEWQTLYGAAAVPDASVTADIYLQWRELSEWRLVNERNTALGLATGSRPREQGAQVPRSLSWHPFRTTRQHLEPFLASITAGGNMIGRTWATDPVTGVVGKDRNLLFALAGGARRCGAQPEGLVTTGLSEVKDVQLLAVAGTRAFDLDPNPLPRDAKGAIQSTPEVHATVAHETAHAIGLQDEYPELGPTLPADRIDGLATAGNIEPAVQLRNAAGQLDGARLRWRWPRIRKAGVLDQPLFAEGGGIYRVVLKTNAQAAQFARNETVFLRQRPLLKPVAAPGGGVNPALISPPLQVDSDPALNEVKVRDPSGTLNAANFTAVKPNESILFSPVPASASAAGEQFAELVAPVIRDWIASSHGPLNAPRATPQQACTDDKRNVQPATNLPAGLPRGRPKFSAWIIGAYDGGARYSCDVFHPAGACLMRALRVPREVKIGGRQVATPNPGILYRFCAVCRYFLVDQLDPTQHGAINAIYDAEYPQP